jgi:hypothetical protein
MKMNRQDAKAPRGKETTEGHKSIHPTGEKRWSEELAHLLFLAPWRLGGSNFYSPN